MAAIDTFEWLAQQVWPSPDDEAKKIISEQRDLLIRMRSEDERLRFLEELMKQVREAKKKRVS
jgi:hypothetical protein